MKKVKYLYCLQAIAYALLLIFSLSSCFSDDLVKQTEERGLIIMKLDGMQTRAAGDPLFADDQETEITKVRIFVFAGSALEVNQLFEAGNTTFNNPFVLDVVTGNKDVYVVANENPTLKTALDAVTTRASLFAVLADEINSPIELPLLSMTGSALNVPVIAQDDPNVRNEALVSLTRVAAKISLNFRKDTDADVTITKVSLLSNAGKTTLFSAPPATAVSPQTYWDFTRDLNTPLQLQTTYSAVDEIGDIYVYENLTEGNKANATQLEVEALFNNIPAKYTVYINENISTPGNPGGPNSSVTTPDDHLYQIKRNHEYKLNGTIKKLGEVDGLLLQVRILPWELIETEQTFDEVPPVINIIPEFTTVEGNTTSIANPLEFEFSLTDGPEGATWEATLDNGLEFGFEDIAQTFGEIGDSKTITIKPLKPFSSTITRTTHFYITVTNPNNGEKQKIPLVEGSNETQILITQVEN